MRIEILKGIRVPRVTWVRVCLLSAILDQPTNGVSTKRNISAGVVGNR